MTFHEAEIEAMNTGRASVRLDGPQGLRLEIESKVVPHGFTTIHKFTYRLNGDRISALAAELLAKAYPILRGLEPA